MKKILTLSSAIILAGCATVPDYLGVAPGSPLPQGFIAACLDHDSVGRCTNWSSNSETCINPAGVDANPPTVPCASINKLSR